MNNMATRPLINFIMRLNFIRSLRSNLTLTIRTQYPLFLKVIAGTDSVRRQNVFRLRTECLLPKDRKLFALLRHTSPLLSKSTNCLRKRRRSAYGRYRYVPTRRYRDVLSDNLVEEKHLLYFQHLKEIYFEYGCTSSSQIY